MLSNITPIPPDEDEQESESPSPIQAVVRIRPLLEFEDGNGSCIAALSTLSRRDVVQEKTCSENASSPPPEYETVVQITEHGGSSNTKLAFDHVFPPSSSQAELYSTCVKPLVRSCLEGYNATILAYGRSDSGKTYTVMGSEPAVEDENHSTGGDDTGLVSRVLKDIFCIIRSKVEVQRLLNSKSVESTAHSSPSSSSLSSQIEPTYEHEVHLQFVEVYCEEIRDLLTTEVDEYSSDEGSFESSQSTRTHSPRNLLQPRVIPRREQQYTKKGCNNKKALFIRDGNEEGEDSEVIGTSTVKVKSAEEALEYFRWGMARRHAKSTATNAVSSRSHAIFTVFIQQAYRDDAKNFDAYDTSMQPQTESVEIITSKINIVDLAGNARMKSSETKGRRRQEIISINKGLLALSNVIETLGNGKPRKHTETQKYVPYRDSKLTRLLRGSFGGNHKTLMIACVSPSNFESDVSLNTLRHANHAKNITNNVKVNTKTYEIDLLSQSSSHSPQNSASTVGIDDNDFNFDLCHMTDSNQSKQVIKTLVEPIEPTVTSEHPAILPDNLCFEEERCDENLQDYRNSRIVKFEKPTPRDISTPSTTDAMCVEEEQDIEDHKSSRNSFMDNFDQSTSRDFTLAVVRDIWMTIMRHEDRQQSTTGEEAQEIPKNPCIDWTIDELYNYLLTPQSHGCISEKVGYVSDENVPPSSGRMTDNCEIPINQTKSLAKSIAGCQEVYLALKVESAKRLLRIQREIDNYAQEKEHLHNIVSLLEEGFVHSKEMAKAVAEKEEQIAKLVEKRGGILAGRGEGDDDIDDVEQLIIGDTEGEGNDGPVSSFSDQSIETDLDEESTTLSPINKRMNATSTKDDEEAKCQDMDKLHLVAELAFDQLFLKSALSKASVSSQTKSSTNQGNDDNEINMINL